MAVRVTYKIKIASKSTVNAVIPKPPGRAILETTEKVILLSASTGGTEVLRIFPERISCR